MKVSIWVPRIALAVIVAGIAGFSPAQYAAAAAGNRSSILVIDRQMIVKNSKLGQDIDRQIQDYVTKARAEFGQQGQQLQSQMQTLQQQPVTADRDKKMQALQLKEAEFHQKVQARQSLIQGGELAAQQRFTTELTAVANAMMQEHGADAVMDKSAVFTSVNGIDVTQAVIQRLDQKITTFKVPLVNPPPGSMPQQQQ
jgi:outer membrane protein